MRRLEKTSRRKDDNGKEREDKKREREREIDGKRARREVRE